MYREIKAPGGSFSLPWGCADLPAPFPVGFTLSRPCCGAASLFQMMCCALGVATPGTPSLVSITGHLGDAKIGMIGQGEESRGAAVALAAWPVLLLSAQPFVGRLAPTLAL